MKVTSTLRLGGFPNKGRLGSPKWMNFRKTSKQPLSSPPPPSFRKTMLRFFREVLKSETFFSQNEGGGSKAVWSFFSENSSKSENLVIP